MAVAILGKTSLLVLTISLWPITSATSPVIPDETQASSTCNNCCQGPAGIPGIPGAAGIPGAPGGFGPQGPVGSKGDVGFPGLSVKGAKGDIGGVGLPGPRGEVGLRGAPGKMGPVGIQGHTGDPGLGGETGRQGQKGEKGEGAIVSRFAGFTVTKTQTQSAGSGIVTFDTVISDVAGDFDTSTNKFTCSIPGYYLFTFNIGAEGTDYAYVGLRHNGNYVVRMHTHSTSNSERNMGTNSALILLESGDQVWLHNIDGKELFTRDYWTWTTFTGVLLHAS